MKPSTVSCSNRASLDAAAELGLKPAPILGPELIREEHDDHGTRPAEH